MSFIQTISEQEATGELAEWYKRVGNPDGTVDNVMKTHSLNVDTLRTHFEMYKQTLHGRSPLSRADREMVAVVVSRLNGCKYCLHHHAAGLKRLLPEERHDIVDQLVAGKSAEISAREAALIEFAARLTSQPQKMARDHVDALRDAGVDDRAILDLAQTIGYFNYVNRIVTGLGVQLGQGEGPPGQWPE